MQVGQPFSPPITNLAISRAGINSVHAEVTKAHVTTDVTISHTKTEDRENQTVKLAHSESRSANPASSIQTISESGKELNNDTAPENELTEESGQKQQDKINKNTQISQQPYTEVELKEIEQLKSREKEVIAHEQAHAAVGGQYTGAPTYDYQTGPNGVRYAVSGEVSIDTSEIPRDPQATLRKAKQIKAAALAPAEPSTQDLKVAAKADRMAANARAEILAETTDRESNGSRSLDNTGRDRLNEVINNHINSKDEDRELMKAKNVYIANYYNSNIFKKNSTTFEVTV